MPIEPDDDALSWGGETDPTHVDSPLASRDQSESDRDEPGMSSALLVTFGLFGGVFLLFAVGWIITVQRMAVTNANPLFEFMSRLGDVLAVVSPAAWFFGVLLLTRERRPGFRVLWMLVGVLLLAPWPFVLGIGAK